MPALIGTRPVVTAPGKARMQGLVPRQGLSNHEVAARNHLVPLK